MQLSILGVMFKKAYRLFVLLTLTLIPSLLLGQTVSVDETAIYDWYRRTQLIESEVSNYSFTILPLDFEKSKKSSITNRTSYLKPFSFAKQKGEIKLLPIHSRVQLTTRHPESSNDGAIIPAKGAQSLVRVGLLATYGPITIKLQPEFVYAANKTYAAYQNYYSNNIDLPRYFNASQKLTRVYGGQSRISLNLGSISFGLSTENLWWGPGIHNSLLMSNAAAGFPHITLNSLKPIKTKYGSIEFQIISGKLNDSGSDLNRFIETQWRYINALVFSYQPKWIPGLFLGTIRSYTKMGPDVEGVGDYLPALFSLGKNYSLKNPDDNTNRDHMESYFMRWVWNKSNVEVYAEFARKENVTSFQTDPIGPIYNHAYTLGFRKLLPLNKTRGTYLSLNVELTQLELNQAILNNTFSWYEHPIVTQGYTHLGQPIGAAIGPGSNAQILDISWTQEFKRIGLRFERLLHNNDYWYKEVKDIRANWVDLSVASYLNWDYKNFLVGAQFKFVKSLNYHWIYTPKLGDPSYFWEGKGLDVLNFQGVISITYRL